MIHIPDNTTDASLFCLPVQTTIRHAFKLALCRISRGLEGVDARIVHTLHDETIAEARDGIEDQESLGLHPALFEPDCQPASVKPWCDHFEDKNPVYDYEDGIGRF